MPPPVQQARSNLGMATTTPVAFSSAGVLYLERMNVLSHEGAGILCGTVPMDGEELPLCFRLSTHAGALRCRARVEGGLPTTPGGLALARREGEKALHTATGNLGDSVTMMFRLADLKPAPGEAPEPPARRDAVHKATGFCVRFLDVGDEVRNALAHHLDVAHRLGDQLAARGGKLVNLGEDDRRTIGTLFSEGQLSKRALDW